GGFPVFLRARRCHRHSNPCGRWRRALDTGSGAARPPCTVRTGGIGQGEGPPMTATAEQQTTSKLSLPALTAMVVGSMVGAGVFQLPARFAAQTGVYGALIAWTIAGLGMLTLAL